MPVEAIIGRVGSAVGKPADVQVVFGIRDVLDFSEWLEPMDAFAMLTPETFRVFDRTAIHFVVSRTVDVRSLGDVGRDREQFVCHECFLQSEFGSKGMSR